jgi:hypothetical protein
VGLQQAGPRSGIPARCPAVAEVRPHGAEVRPLAARVTPDAAWGSLHAAEWAGGGMPLTARAGHAKPAGQVSVNPVGRHERQSRQSCTVAACTGKHVPVWEPAIGGTHGQVSPRMPMVIAPGNTGSQFSGSRNGLERGCAVLADLRSLHSGCSPDSVQPGHADVARMIYRISAGRLVSARVAGAAVAGERRYSGPDTADRESHNESATQGPGTGPFPGGPTMSSTGPNGDTP